MPLTIDELKSTGAVDAPVVKGISRRPRVGLTRVWTIKDPKAKSYGIVQSYTVPLPEKVRKAKANAIRWDNRKRELQGEGMDGVVCSTLYGPLPRPPEVPKTLPSDPLFVVDNKCRVCGQEHRKLC